MKTLQEIKDEYAISAGGDSFKHLIMSKLISNKGGVLHAYEIIDYILIKVTEEAQRECLNNVYNTARIEVSECDRFGHKCHKLTTGGLLDDGTLYEVNKDSIINEKNIIR